MMLPVWMFLRRTVIQDSSPVKLANQREMVTYQLPIFLPKVVLDFNDEITAYRELDAAIGMLSLVSD
jgi:hypothetical protein